MPNLTSHLIDAYLAYLNNYLTPTVFAEHHGLTAAQAKSILHVGKDLHEKGTHQDDQ